MKTFILILVLTGSALAQPWSGIVASSRATDWSTAGVQGGIPSAGWANCVTAACNTVFAGTVTTASVNAAISSALANTVVRIPAGTFTISGGILANNKSNVAIRGAGSNSTFLNFTGSESCAGTSGLVCFKGSDVNYFLSPQNLTNWTAGFSVGTTNLTFAAVTSLAIGDMISIDQLDDVCGTITAGHCAGDNNAIFVCYTPQFQCSTNGDNGGSLRANRGQQEMVTVTNIVGNVVTISPALRMQNWAIGKTPQAWWSSNPSMFVGIEDISLSGSSGIAMVQMFNCNDCWVRGIRTIGPPGRSHVMLFQSGRSTIRDSYFYKTNDSASVNYGVEAFPSGDTLVENNIFEQIQAPYPTNATCTGCVFSYNFDVNNVFTSTVFQNQSGFAHAVGDDFMLFEGNIGSGFNADNFHGTHHLITNFRNYWNGYQKNEGTFTNQATTPLIAQAYSRFFNHIGNVLGNPARHATYTSLFDIGSGNSIPDDPQTGITLMRWGNFANCSGVSPCQTNVFNNAEVPSALTGTQAPFLNTIPASQTLPASFYLASKPAFFGAKAWPPIGPDISGGDVKYCVGGTQTGTYVLTSGQCPGGTATTMAGGRITSNPAMDCYLNTMGGSPDGQGAVSTFSPDLCYTISTSPTVSLSPTSLTFSALLVGLSSPTQLIMLTNTGTATLTVTSIAASGDFSQTNNCGATLGISASCTITVTFTPTNSGVRSGAITITDNATGSPHSVSLSGTGIAPTIYRPTAITDSGFTPVTNPAFAYDGDFTTFATGVATNTTGYTIVYSGFPATIGTPLNAALYLYEDAYNAGAGAGGTQVEYSLDGGINWTQLWVGPTHGAQNSPLVDRVVLSPSQNFSLVQVRLGQLSACAPGGCTITHQAYEIWIQTGVIATQIQGGNLFTGGNVIQ